MKKKKLKVNAAICDARNVKETVLESYESININAGLMLVSNESKELLSRYDVSMNAGKIEEAPADIELIVQNGKYEITDGTRLANPVVLLVNGKLDIKTSSQEVLGKFHTIIVNGKVSYPSNIEDSLANISVNGKMESYPADAIRLNNRFTMDRTFIIRAENAKYYASSKVIISDKNLDIDSLLEKQAKFITKKAVIAEELLEKALPLFDEDVEIETIPLGYAYLGTETLRDVLIRKHGDSLYVDGSLTITPDGEEALNKLKNVKVMGTVYIIERLIDKFYEINSEYNNIKTIKGTIMGDRASLTIDSRLLRKHDEGITIQDCAIVNLKDDISPDEIEENLQFVDCACINCNEEQKSAVEAVADGVALIDDSGKMKASGLGKLLDASGILDKDTKSINTISYTL